MKRNCRLLISLHCVVAKWPFTLSCDQSCFWGGRILMLPKSVMWIVYYAKCSLMFTDHWDLLLSVFLQHRKYNLMLSGTLLESVTTVVVLQTTAIVVPYTASWINSTVQTSSTMTSTSLTRHNTTMLHLMER